MRDERERAGETERDRDRERGVCVERERERERDLPASDALSSFIFNNIFHCAVER